MIASPKALYYPHTRIHSEELLKTALLLWDQIECIIPSGHVSPQATQDSYAREAEEIVVRQRIPTVDEKRRVNSRVKRLLVS